MPDPRPRPWELKVVTVWGGYRPMWEKQVWNCHSEDWEPWVENLPGPTMSTREECEAAIGRMMATGVTAPEEVG